MHIESQLFSPSVPLTHPNSGPLRDVGPWQVWSSPWEGRNVALHLFPSCATTSLARAIHIKQAWNLPNLTGFTSVFHEISTIYIFCVFKKRLFAHPLSLFFSHRFTRVCMSGNIMLNYYNITYFKVLPTHILYLSRTPQFCHGLSNNFIKQTADEASVCIKTITGNTTIYNRGKPLQQFIKR